MTRLLFVLISVLWAGVPAVAQTSIQSSCADCHFANSDDTRLTPFARAHADAWDHSAHGRNQVSCEKCHGGDATTFDRARAHRGVRVSSDPESPVAARNLPRTCGTCHAGPFVAFQKSRHYALIVAKDERGPSCATCHGDVAAFLFTPASVEARCNHCHDAKSKQPRPQNGPEAGALLKTVRGLHSDLDEARKLIRLIRDRAEKNALEEQFRQAEVPYLEARDAAHAFVFEAARERLGVARERVNVLLQRLTERVAAR